MNSSVELSQKHLPQLLGKFQLENLSFFFSLVICKLDDEKETNQLCDEIRFIRTD